MPGFDGTGPLGVGPRLGRCLFPGGGLLLNLALFGLGFFVIKRLLDKDMLRPKSYIKTGPNE